MTNPDVIQRLKSARGHLDAVIRMVDDDRYCIDVLQQVGAVQAALDRSRRSILEHHLRTCVADGYAQGRVEEMTDELLGAFFGGRGHSSGTTYCGRTRHEEASP
jgi:CsoR family transcriptional regulator, copper-sensing transcriptional repressor